MANLDFSPIDRLRRGADNAPAAPAVDPAAAPENYAQRKQREQDLTKQILAERQDAIARTEILTSDIMRGLKEGQNPVRLLLMAIEAVSLATGNSVLYDQAKERISAVYGQGLHDKDALEIEIAETRKRLDRLKEAQKEDYLTTRDRVNIREAIRAHTEALARMQAVINDLAG